MPTTVILKFVNCTGKNSFNSSHLLGTRDLTIRQPLPLSIHNSTINIDSTVFDKISSFSNKVSCMSFVRLNLLELIDGRKSHWGITTDESILKPMVV